jgi:hypothetical protein
MTISASAQGSRKGLIFSSIVFCLLAMPTRAGAQVARKEYQYRDMTWFGYFNQSRLTNRSGVWVDLHLRLDDHFIRSTHAFLARMAYIYFVNDRTRISAGYAYQDQPQHTGSPQVLEHRPWQQIQWFEKKPRFVMMQWVRLEQRFRKTADEIDYNFTNHRIRYNMAFTIPLIQKEVKPRTPFLFVNNEVFINMGKNIVHNYFDQNRFFAGAGYQFSTHLNAHIGYMNVFQQLPAGNRYISTDAIRLFVFHSLDFRKPE